MSDIAKTPRTRPPAGTGRLGIASGLFTVFGAFAAFVTVQMGRAILITPVGPVETKLVFALAGAASLTFGCLRTGWLLDRRRKEGVAAAAIFLLAPLCGYFTGTPPTFDIVGGAVAGLALLAGVWPHLEN